MRCRMSAVDEPSRSPDEGAPSKINPGNKPQCLAEGMIPWLAGHIEWVPIAEIKVSSPSLRRHNPRSSGTVTRTGS